MDEKNELRNFYLTEINEIIEESFESFEKEDFKKSLKILKIDIEFIIDLFFKNENCLTNLFLNPDFSSINKDQTVQNFIDQNFENLSIPEFEKIFLYFRRIVIIVYTKYKTKYDLELKSENEFYKENMSLLNERFVGNEIKSNIKLNSFTKFRFKGKFNNNSTILFTNLRDLKKIDSTTIIDNFEIIFSIRKYNKQFKKVNWVASIYQLKKLIKLMMDKQILENDVNYLDTIIDCFKLKNEDITKQKLDARGEPRSIEYQNTLLVESFKLKTTEN